MYSLTNVQLLEAERLLHPSTADPRFVVGCCVTMLLEESCRHDDLGADVVSIETETLFEIPRGKWEGLRKGNLDDKLSTRPRLDELSNRVRRGRCIADVVVLEQSLAVDENFDRESRTEGKNSHYPVYREWSDRVVGE